MAKMKFERKGAFAQAVEEENVKANEALKVVAEKTSTGDIAKIEICQIENPRKHDRVGYSHATLKEMALSLKEVGQLQPIVVRKTAEDKYERIIGFRRIEAAKIAGWEEISAIVLENISDDVAALMMLSENLHREDPNVYDQTLKLLEFISISIGTNEEELIKQLYRFRNFDSNRVGDLTDQEKELREKIEAVLERTAKISLTTMVDRLRVLSLDDSLIHAMREKGLTYANAVEMNKVKSKEDMKALLLKAIAEKPSKNEVIAWVKALKEENRPEAGQGSLQDTAKSIAKSLTAKRLKKLSSEDQSKVADLLKRLEEILN